MHAEVNTLADLGQFTGSEHLYAHPISKKLVYTDGIRYVAEQAGAYWLLDILALQVAGRAINDREPFGVVFLHVENGSASLEVWDDVPVNRFLFQQNIEFTDFPEGRWKFYITWDGERATLMLTTEY